jgi:succinate dehydrogenase / fumarate reductase cytochrome b subunit
MSISHRASGVFLSVIGAPLLLWWALAVSSGPEAYETLMTCLGGWIGKLLVIATAISLCFHLLNGIRHLVWDTGHALDLKSAYTGGWLVLIGTVLLTAALLGVLL